MHMEKKFIPIAEIVGVHGVKGWVKLKIFSDDPEKLASYDLFEETRQKISIKALHAHGTIWLAQIDGIEDRTAAEKKRGQRLYISRQSLPSLGSQNEFYHADLIGLSARNSDGESLGKVIGVANFGAGDLLDIKPAKGNSFYIPFTKESVPEVRLDQGEIIIDPPPGLLD